MGGISGVRSPPPGGAGASAAAAARAAPGRVAGILRPPAPPRRRRALVVRGAGDAGARGRDRAPPRGAGGPPRATAAGAPVRHARLALDPDPGRARGGRGGVPHADPGRRPLPGQPLPAARRPAGGRRLRPVRDRRRGAADRPYRLRRRAVGHGRQPLAGAVPRPRRPQGPERADQGHPAGRARAGARDVREGPRRERDDRRPRAQRPGPRVPPGHRSRRRAGRGRPHAGVWHMVSEVEGELRDGVGDADLLRATFPPGSVTGAPKLAALGRHRRAGVHRSRGLHGRDRLREPARRLGAQRRHPHVRGPRAAHLAGRRAAASSPTPTARRGARGGREGGAAACGDRRPRAGDVPGAPADAPGTVPGHFRRGSRGAGRGPCRGRPAAGLYETLLVQDGAARGLDAHSRGSRGACARSTGSRCRPTWPPGSRTRRADTRGRGCASTSCRARRPRWRSPSSQSRRPRCCGRWCSRAGWVRTSGATARCWRPTRPTTRPRCRCSWTRTGTCSRPADERGGGGRGRHTAHAAGRRADPPGRDRRRPARDAAGAHARRPPRRPSDPRHERAARPRPARLA
jgi:hypothetical protein